MYFSLIGEFVINKPLWIERKIPFTICIWKH